MAAAGLTGLAPPMRGGIAHYTLHLGAAMGDICRTRLFAWYRQYPDLLFPGRRQTDPGARGPSVEAMRTLDPLLPWTWTQTIHEMCSFGATRVVHQWWHPWFAPATWSLLNMLRTRGVRTSVLCHNIEPHERIVGAASATRRALAAAHVIVVHGESDAVRARRWWPRADVRSHTHPAYEDMTRTRRDRAGARRALGLDERGRVILMFGCIKPYKGLEDLIEAMGHIRKVRTDCTLVVAGEFYEPRLPYDARIQALGIADAVRILDGYVPDAQVGTLMRAADVVALPYRHATGSGVLPTAFAAGIPVVTTRTGNLPETIVEGARARIVEPGDPASLARALLDVLSDPPAMGAAGMGPTAASWKTLAETLLS